VRLLKAGTITCTLDEFDADTGIMMERSPFSGMNHTEIASVPSPNPVPVMVRESNGSAEVSLSELIWTAEDAAVTVNVKLWVAFGETPFAAVKVRGNTPLAVGVPLRALAANVTPPGSAPDSVIVGVGVPVAVTENEPASPWVKLVAFALVIAGATCAAFTVNVKF
jgi:hypothetical protein